MKYPVLLACLEAVAAFVICVILFVHNISSFWGAIGIYAGITVLAALLQKKIIVWRKVLISFIVVFTVFAAFIFFADTTAKDVYGLEGVTSVTSLGFVNAQIQ
ncbi:MAG: hypothetical protein KKC05_01340 [Nanoarchaeota archaeon]|nr:hypothetical protein [Nanoarchaeota archaeon]